MAWRVSVGAEGAPTGRLTSPWVAVRRLESTRLAVRRVTPGPAIHHLDWATASAVACLPRGRSCQRNPHSPQKRGRLRALTHARRIAGNCRPAIPH